ncbi:MAG: hypothetical protein M1553_09585 [Firmicutes bacterium]|nr:hypothetical protein [Bacillota bacterium]
MTQARHLTVVKSPASKKGDPPRGGGFRAIKLHRARPNRLILLTPGLVVVTGVAFLVLQTLMGLTSLVLLLTGGLKLLLS